MPIVPKISVSSVSHVLKAPEVIAVASAVILAPALAPMIDTWIQKIPYLGQHRTAGLVILGLIVLLIATKMKAGAFRAIVIGASASFFLLGVTPYLFKIIPR